MEFGSDWNEKRQNYHESKSTVKREHKVRHVYTQRLRLRQTSRMGSTAQWSDRTTEVILEFHFHFHSSSSENTTDEMRSLEGAPTLRVKMSRNPMKFLFVGLPPPEFVTINHKKLHEKHLFKRFFFLHTTPHKIAVRRELTCQSTDIIVQSIIFNLVNIPFCNKYCCVQ